MNERKIRVAIEFTRKQFCAVLAVLISAAAVWDLASESLTLSTSYPAPSGVYHQMITTGSAFLARDSGANNSKVGIGTTAPAALLDVNGNIIAADPTADNHVATKSYVDAMVGAAAGGGFTHSVTFFADGSWTVPEGVNKIMVELWGAGGDGGAGTCGSGGQYNGGGGGAGGYGKGQISPVAPGETLTIKAGSPSSVMRGAGELIKATAGGQGNNGWTYGGYGGNHGGAGVGGSSSAPYFFPGQSGTSGSQFGPGRGGNAYPSFAGGDSGGIGGGGQSPGGGGGGGTCAGGPGGKGAVIIYWY